jgi:hypothetical protein
LSIVRLFELVYKVLPGTNTLAYLNRASAMFNIL